MSNSLYKDAISRLDLAASYLNVDPESVEKLKYLKSCFEVSIPARMDEYARISRYASPGAVTGKPISLGGSNFWRHDG